jgi:hypothetical protein
VWRKHQARQSLQQPKEVSVGSATRTDVSDMQAFFCSTRSCDYLDVLLSLFDSRSISFIHLFLISLLPLYFLTVLSFACLFSSFYLVFLSFLIFLYFPPCFSLFVSFSVHSSNVFLHCIFFSYNFHFFSVFLFLFCFPTLLSDLIAKNVFSQSEYLEFLVLL